MRITFILVLALCAIATARLSPLEVYQSFAQKLNLQPAVQLELTKCTTDLHTFAFKVYQDFTGVVPRRNIVEQLTAFTHLSDEEHLRILNKWAADAQPVAASCGQYLSTIYSAIPIKREQGQEHLHAATVLEQNALKHHAHIIGHIVSVVQHAKAGEGQKVGNCLAEILLILTGNSRPEEVKLTNLRSIHKVAPINPTIFVQEFVNALLKGLHSTEQVTVQELDQVNRAVYEIGTRAMEFRTRLHSHHSLIEKVVLLLSVPNMATAEVAQAEAALKPILQKFKNVNVHGSSAGKALLNVAANLSHVEQQLENVYVDFVTNKPAEAGSEIAAIINEVGK